MSNVSPRHSLETHHRGIDRGAKRLPPHNFTGVNLLQILDAEAYCDEASSLRFNEGKLGLV